MSARQGRQCAPSGATSQRISCACCKSLEKFDTDAVMDALKGVRDLVQPSAEGRTFDMLSADDFYALMDLVVTHLEVALQRERHGT